MNNAQKNKIAELRKQYAVEIIDDNGVLGVKVRASNGILYYNYIIGSRGGVKENGSGKESGSAVLKQIEKNI